MKNRRSNRGRSIHWSGAKDRHSSLAERKRDDHLLKMKSKMEAADMKDFIKKLGQLLSINDLRFYGSLWEQASAGKALTQKQRFFKSKIEKKIAERTFDRSAARSSERKGDDQGKTNERTVILRKKTSRDE